MSVSAESSSPPAEGQTPTEDQCFQCGSPLAEDQEWCLECGAARTLIHRPPDWRVPVAVVGTVVVLVLAGFAIALINLSSTANRQAGVGGAPTSAAATSSVASSPATSTPTRTIAPTTAAAAPRFPDWPVGLPGWTVVLDASRNQATANSDAARFAAAGLHVGVLESSQHPDLIPGFWTVFTGRYPDQSAALASATALIARGYRGAHVRLVAPAGTP